MMIQGRHFRLEAVLNHGHPINVRVIGILQSVVPGLRKDRVDVGRIILIKVMVDPGMVGDIYVAVSPVGDNQVTVPAGNRCPLEFRRGLSPGIFSGQVQSIIRRTDPVVFHQMTHANPALLLNA